MPPVETNATQNVGWEDDLGGSTELRNASVCGHVADGGFTGWDMAQSSACDVRPSSHSLQIDVHEDGDAAPRPPGPQKTRPSTQKPETWRWLLS